MTVQKVHRGVLNYDSGQRGVLNYDPDLKPELSEVLKTYTFGQIPRKKSSSSKVGWMPSLPSICWLFNSTELGLQFRHSRLQSYSNYTVAPLLPLSLKEAEE
ncbi:hypothetical protein ILYODFUR_035957 [Ilyodon furcidens]|uniref:Uncharacterized protein n=1 Tax=Ilyodon furcidens TaxID=33524 RepID=A0ABV0TSK5_9TELE